jgi:hypothetical protein
MAVIGLTLPYTQGKSQRVVPGHRRRSQAKGQNYGKEEAGLF